MICICLKQDSPLNIYIYRLPESLCVHKYVFFLTCTWHKTSWNGWKHPPQKICSDLKRSGNKLLHVTTILILFKSSTSYCWFQEYLFNTQIFTTIKFLFGTLTTEKKKKSPFLPHIGFKSDIVKKKQEHVNFKITESGSKSPCSSIPQYLRLGSYPWTRPPNLDGLQTSAFDEPTFLSRSEGKFWMTACMWDVQRWINSSI